MLNKKGKKAPKKKGITKIEELEVLGPDGEELIDVEDRSTKSYYWKKPKNTDDVTWHSTTVRVRSDGKFSFSTVVSSHQDSGAEYATLRFRFRIGSGLVSNTLTKRVKFEIPEDMTLYLWESPGFIGDKNNKHRKSAFDRISGAQRYKENPWWI